MLLLDETLRGMLRLPSCTLDADNFLNSLDEGARSQLLAHWRDKAKGDAILLNATVCRDENCIDVLMQGAVVLRDAGGRAVRCAGFLIEVKNAFSVPRVYNSPEVGAWEWNSVTGRCSFCADYHKMLGYDWPGESMPQTFEGWVNLVHPDDLDAVEFQRQMIASPDCGDTFECTIRLQHKKGHYIWTIGRGFVAQRDFRGQALAMRGINQNIEVVRERYAKSLEHAMHDALTGCYNRRFFREEWPVLKNRNQWPFSFLYIDICGLKMLNDTLGHASGDRFILEAVNIISTAIQMPKYIVRMGGDEFLVVLPDCHPQLAQECAQNLKRWLIAQKNEEIPVRFAVGASTMNADMPLETAISAAEQEMRHAKERSRPEDHQLLLSHIERVSGRTVHHHDDRLKPAAQREEA